MNGSTKNQHTISRDSHVTEILKQKQQTQISKAEATNTTGNRARKDLGIDCSQKTYVNVYRNRSNRHKTTKQKQPTQRETELGKLWA